MLFHFIWMIVGSMLLVVFYKKWLLCMIVRWLLFYIHFIDLFFYLLRSIYFICLHLNYCRWYFIGCFSKSELFACLWKDHYHISRTVVHSLLLCLLRYICWFFSLKLFQLVYYLLFLRILITLYNYEMIFFLLSSTLIDSLFA